MTVLDRAPAAPAQAVDRTGPPIAPLVAAVGTGLLAVLAAALVVGGAAAGTLVDVGIPASRLAGRIAALGTLGALLYAAVLRPPASPLAAGSRRALGAASAWATAWAVATAVQALLTMTQLVGGTPGGEAVRTFLTDLPAGRAAVVVLAVSALVALTARRCTTAAHAGVLVLLAATALVVPAVLTGHSSAAEDHLLAVTSLGVHVVAASLWIGGLLALLLHGRGRDDAAPAAARFSVLALACFLATGLSGVVSAWIVLGGLPGVLGSGYGWLLAAKAAALGVLGVLGWVHRRRTLPRLRAGAPGSFRRLAVVEVVVMLATVALSVGLAASPPPAAAPAAVTAPSPSAGAPQGPGAPAADATGADPMAGHDHGELSVALLVDGSRFHVAGPVAAGSRVSVHNATGTEVTITAADGSFDVVVPAHALMTFPAPEAPGSYAFSSRHSPDFADVLVVR